jgi:hypothetical protein
MLVVEAAAADVLVCASAEFSHDGVELIERRMD